MMRTILTAMAAFMLLGTGVAAAQDNSRSDGRDNNAGTSRSQHERCVNYDRHITTNKLFRCMSIENRRAGWYDTDVTGSTNPAPVVGPDYDGDGAGLNDW